MVPGTGKQAVLANKGEPGVNAERSLCGPQAVKTRGPEAGGANREPGCPTLVGLQGACLEGQKGISSVEGRGKIPRLDNLSKGTVCVGH